MQKNVKLVYPARSDHGIPPGSGRCLVTDIPTIERLTTPDERTLHFGRMGLGGKLRPADSLAL